jgi:cell division protein FtsA
MFSKPQPTILVGLEIGTTKICAVVGELSPEGNLHIVGIGQSVSKGVRKGEIVDTQQAEEDIRRAIAEAENMADVEVHSLVIGVTGSHIRSLNNRGVHPVASAEAGLTDADVEDVVRNAKVVNLGTDRELIHAIRQHFTLDGQRVINPVGMSGRRLEVEMHVVSGSQSRMENSIRLIKGLQLKVDDIAFNGLASALALLNSEQKELGALVIDMGAGTTDYAVFSQGVLKHCGTLAVGGDHVTNDLSQGLKVTLRRAEQLKLERGGALPDDSLNGQSLTFHTEHGMPLKTVNLGHLRQIMHARLEEIFEVIAADLRPTGLLPSLNAGAFLCGGGAHIPQINTLAEHVLELPVATGRANGVSGLATALDKPEFATGIGLVKYWSLRAKPRPPKKKTDLIAGVRERFTQALSVTRLFLL